MSTQLIWECFYDGMQCDREMPRTNGAGYIEQPKLLNEHQDYWVACEDCERNFSLSGHCHGRLKVVNKKDGRIPFKSVRDKLLQKICRDAEQEAFFHGKTSRTSMRTDEYEEALKTELFYTDRLLEDIKTAQEYGISEAEIEEMRGIGVDKAYEVLEEADNEGWR